MKKRILSLLLATVMLMTLLPMAALAGDTADTTWYNEADSEFVLYDAASLVGFAQLVNGGNNFEGKIVKLGADIDLTGIEWEPIGGLDASCNFKGEFDGCGYTIANLMMDLGDRGEAKTRAGLFASTCSKIHDFTLSNVNISASGSDLRVGALGGNVWGGSVISDVIVDGFTFNGSGYLYVGGIAGRCYEQGALGASGVAVISDCVVKNVNIAAEGYTEVGGVLGANSGYFSIDNVDVEGAVINANVTQNNGSENCGIGGFFGSDALGGAYDYKNCDVAGLEITVNGTVGAYVGGFAGRAMGGNCWANPNISCCSAQGKIVNNNTAEDMVLGGYYAIANGGARQFDRINVAVDIESSVGTVGGFVGVSTHWYDNKQQYSNCVVSGNVTGATVGGFYGKADAYASFVCCTAGTVNGVADGSFTCIKDYEAVVNDTYYYASLPFAVKAAQTGDTVKVLKDIAVPADVHNHGENNDVSCFYITIDKPLTLDLNGKTIMFSDEFKACGPCNDANHVMFRITGDADVVVTGNGTINSYDGTYDGSEMFRIANAPNAKLTIENGNFYGPVQLIYIQTAGTVIINGGRFENNTGHGDGHKQIFNTNGYWSFNESKNITMYGGTVVTCDPRLLNDGSVVPEGYGVSKKAVYSEAFEGMVNEYTVIPLDCRVVASVEAAPEDYDSNHSGHGHLPAIVTNYYTSIDDATAAAKEGESVTEVSYAHDYKMGSCTVCGANDPDHEHNYEVVSYKPATCTEDGYKECACDCGAHYTEVIDAHGHLFNGRTCILCGYKIPLWLYIKMCIEDFFENIFG